MIKYSKWESLKHWVYHVESVRVQMQVHDGYFVFGKLVYVGKYFWTMGK